MTKSEANRIIHEARGLEYPIWHSYYTDRHDYMQHCSCGAILTDEELGPHLAQYNVPDPDYHTPEGIFLCWNWAKDKEWWKDFYDWAWYKWLESTPIEAHTSPEFQIWFIETFAITLAEYLNNRVEK